ncbi:MAG TPA: hypothetical protein VJ892_01585 [Candidatus Absconditabacterales bacterium]|nr:hypothetical protein [Candidatus Absconditabacterales bacterium]
MTEEKKTINKASTKKMSNEDLIEKHNQMIQFVKNTLSGIDTDLKRIKLVLNKLSKFDPSNEKSLDDEEISEAIGGEELKSYKEEDVQVVEGKFDGYFMIGADQKKYPVPLNYSSKTKLVPGDVLKLKILDNGQFVYKLINPVERKHIRAMLSKTDDNKYTAVTDDGKTYFLNQAAVTFFKGRPGDELYILTNEKSDAGFAAIEAVIKK